MHECMFIMIQPIEFFWISYYLLTWSRDEGFFHEWVTTVLHYRKALELLESRNGLYVLFGCRQAIWIGALTKSQLPQGRQKDVIMALRGRKLGVYIRKKARGYPRTRRKSICNPNPSSFQPCELVLFLPCSVTSCTKSLA
ncbi:hypothetical protein NC653_018126 [Populus alba x Populus x berolinensis]|uniref:Uncharacterized protein n=1 Tax=Populus alba x Populus x berolinensis TaxID=444605 RepID=A0AAD6QSB4_9ROSI|nr:hypothetical protein NC653_018126 [Populus alba x Populus x berolinensis]